MGGQTRDLGVVVLWRRVEGGNGVMVCLMYIFISPGFGGTTPDCRVRGWRRRSVRGGGLVSKRDLAGKKRKRTRGP